MFLACYNIVSQFSTVNWHVFCIRDQCMYFCDTWLIQFAISKSHIFLSNSASSISLSDFSLSFYEVCMFLFSSGTASDLQNFTHIKGLRLVTKFLTNLTDTLLSFVPNVSEWFFLLKMNRIDHVSLPFPEARAWFLILFSGSYVFSLVFVYMIFKNKYFSQICFLANV